MLTGLEQAVRFHILTLSAAVSCSQPLTEYQRTDANSHQPELPNTSSGIRTLLLTARNELWNAEFGIVKMPSFYFKKTHFSNTRWYITLFSYHSQSDFCTDEGQVVMWEGVPLRYTARKILTSRQFFLAVFRGQVWSMYCKKDSLKYSFGSNQERWRLKIVLLYTASWTLFSSHKPVILFKW